MQIPLTRLLKFLEIRKFSGAADQLHRPLTWRSLMSRVLWPNVAHRSRRLPRFVFWLLAALVAPGCGHEAKIEFKTVTKPPTVQVINPAVRTIVRVVGQPSFIESYERTSIFPKLTALYREVERGHRRQGHEGADARHPVRARAGRGSRDEEGDGQAR